MEGASDADAQQRVHPAATGTVYTAVSIGYDHKPLDGYSEPGVEVDRRMMAIKGRDATLWNRENKILKPPTTGLWSVYVDGSLRPTGPLAAKVEGWLEKADIAMFKHPHRTCAYAEIDACVTRNKITAEEGEKARSMLMLAGFPRDYGLWACGMIARRSNANPIQTNLAPVWWAYVKELPRDQIWLPLVLFHFLGAKNRIHTIDDDIFENPHFSFRRHA